jgi:hypothetical protein
MSQRNVFFENKIHHLLFSDFGRRFRWQQQIYTAKKPDLLTKWLTFMSRNLIHRFIDPELSFEGLLSKVFMKPCSFLHHFLFSPSHTCLHDLVLNAQTVSKWCLEVGIVNTAILTPLFHTCQFFLWRFGR